MADFTLSAGGSGEDFEPIPDDTIVVAELVSAAQKTSKAGNERVSFRFQILEGEFLNRTLWGSTPITFTSHPECKLRQWVEALLGSEDGLEEGFSFSLEALEGAQVRVVVGSYIGTNGDRLNSVEDIIAIRDADRVKETVDSF